MHGFIFVRINSLDDKKSSHQNMFVNEIRNFKLFCLSLLTFFLVALLIHFVWRITKFTQTDCCPAGIFQLSEALQYYKYYCANMRNDAKACRPLTSWMNEWKVPTFRSSSLYKHTHISAIFFLPQVLYRTWYVRIVYTRFKNAQNKRKSTTFF